MNWAALSALHSLYKWVEVQPVIDLGGIGHPPNWDLGLRGTPCLVKSNEDGLGIIQLIASLDSCSTSNSKEPQCKGVLGRRNGEWRGCKGASGDQSFLGKTGETQGGEFGGVMCLFLWPFLWKMPQPSLNCIQGAVGVDLSQGHAHQWWVWRNITLGLIGSVII